MTHQYTYTVSAAFLSGTVAAGLEFAALVVLVLVYVLGYVRYMRGYSVQEHTIRAISRSTRNGSAQSSTDGGSNGKLLFLQPAAVSWVRNAAIYVTFGLV